MSAKDIACEGHRTVIKDFDDNLVLFGKRQSAVSEASSWIKTANEVFADRTTGMMEPNPKIAPNALIEDADKAIQQVLEIIIRKVTTVSGKQIPISAETICIHGDGKNAIEFAKNIYGQLKQNNIAIKAI
jgi:UPF0271 protein